MCEKGLSLAQYNYALALEKGKGIAIDVVKAAKFYKLAADQRQSSM